MIDEAISKVRAHLSSSDMVISHKVRVDESDEDSVVLVQLRVRNFIDSPSDIVRVTRKTRNLIPRQYNVKFTIIFTM